ncbi:MAG TPA: RDD family protein [Vicinamibacterales bacterium]|jgi:uncharacterized RDD family membrane protein YckC|nr:RDD family protein [Vicinamibacterales bacterium]
MKCPKCQYIGFEQGNRCRNCGYDFSLSNDLAELDLPIKTGDEALGPLADFDLVEERDVVAAEQSSARQADPMPATRVPELPLFRDRVFDDDRPLVSLPATPRAPVSVRKSAPVRNAERERAEEPVLDLEPSPAVPSGSRRRHTRLSDAPVTEPEPTDDAAAPAGARLMGATIDLLLLAAIDVTVVYLTLRLCDLNFAQLRQVPIVPLAAFLAMLNGGYMAAFTAAGGQSIGKMAAGTRVVSVDESAATSGVRLGQSVVRAAAYAVSVLPAGLGFLPALFGADRRALHDRLAQTRVVRA